jgi:hypothetical protein
MDIPQSVEEANQQGYPTEQKTLEEAKKIMESGAGPHIESKGAGKDCSTIPPGHLCWEGDCNPDGWQEVMYCDGVQGCTIYAKVRCKP